MQDDVREMMSPRLYAVKRAVEHVRHGGEGMPVICVDVGERPLDPRPGETICDYRIRVNVLIVIVINETEMECFLEREPNNSYKENANTDRNQSSLIPFVPRTLLLASCSL